MMIITFNITSFHNIFLNSIHEMSDHASIHVYLWLYYRSVLTILYRPFEVLAPKDLRLPWPSNLFTLSVPNEGYSSCHVSELVLNLHFQCFPYIIYI